MLDAKTAYLNINKKTISLIVNKLSVQMKPAIVVVAYNRANALSRLLDSIKAAKYDSEVELVISLEGGATEEVQIVAQKFECQSINKRIINNEVRLGLRNHIIKCGDLVDEYGSVIVLEDDLLVDKYFYHYASRALHYYDDSDKVAGVALYSYEHNDYAGMPFRPMINGCSTYMMQVVCSWGQCWTKKQWHEFKKWYSGKIAKDVDVVEDLPLSIKLWPESSWKKYYSAYIVLMGKYFIYPYQSYSTNCSDPGGTHIKNGTFIHQVSMGSQNRNVPDFRFVDDGDNEVLYDSFMSPVGEFVYRTLGFKRNEVLVDLFGIKSETLVKTYSYVLSPFKVDQCIAGYPLHFKPIENNFAYPVKDLSDAKLYLMESKNYKPRRYFCGVDCMSYYAGFNLKSLNRIYEFLRLLPVLFLHRLKQIINK